MNNDYPDLCIKNGIIITPFKLLKDKSILVKEGKIISIAGIIEDELKNTKIIDAEGNYIVPGFIDLHAHGGGGADTMDGSSDSIKKIAETHCTYGTTSFLATTMTMSSKHILNSLKAVKESSKQGTGYASVLGIHLEGPYINEAMKGAQNKEYIKSPVIEEFQEFNRASGNLIKIVTVAPELPGAIDFIRWLKSQNIIASAGHTNATYEQTMEGISAGLEHITAHF
ncbi:MAG: amidohydrolase family protein [Actinomycetota bacterium]|nr:amidohydrolase family protein [Actinomycetota bacterium]